MKRDSQRPGRRNPRSDKGAIYATPRDLYCITWIAEQYVARFDQIQQLLSRFPDPARPFLAEKIAETTTRDQISRWRRAGWIEYERFLAKDRGYAWVTRRGLQLVELDGIYTARPPAATRLAHLYAINQVRLWMDEDEAGLIWTSERRYRAVNLEKKKGKKDESSGPIPDALIQAATIPRKTAVEVEVSVKRPDVLLAKLEALVRAIAFDDEIGNYAKQFQLIWFYVPNERIQRAVEQARADLPKEERDRVGVVVESDLLA